MTGVSNLGLQPIKINNYLVRLAVKFVPWSHVMTEGTPTFINNSIKASHTAFAVNDFNKNTVGHLVQESTTHKQYLWPAADAGSIGPTQSIVILLNATSFLAIGVIGTLSITKLLAFS